MDIDQWAVLKENIGRKFPIEEEGTEVLEMPREDEIVRQGTADFIIIQTPLGRIKVSFQKRPAVIDKKLIKSRRAGESEHTEYKFSDSEFTFKLKAYKWNESQETWEEIDAANFN